MKKIMLPVAALIMAGLFMIPVKKANAQMGYGGGMSSITYGVKVGPSFSSMATKTNGDKETSDMLVGLEGGVYANIPIAPQFYIQPSLMYEGKGGKQSVTGGEVKMRLNYLTLPIDFLFKPEMPNGSGSWIIGVGPYLGYGISGSTSSDLLDGSYDPFKEVGGEGGTTSEALLKRFDAGANVQLGYEMANGFNIGLNANLGLINIANNGDDDNSIKNTNFGVTLGYTFGKY